jgi:hypothetical protein
MELALCGVRARQAIGCVEGVAQDMFAALENARSSRAWVYGESTKRTQ